MAKEYISDTIDSCLAALMNKKDKNLIFFYFTPYNVKIVKEYISDTMETCLGPLIKLDARIGGMGIIYSIPWTMGATVQKGA